MMYGQEQTLLRSAKGLGLSVEPICPTFSPFPLKFAATMNHYVDGDGARWDLSRIWALNTYYDFYIGPLGFFLPVGLYGKITAYVSQSLLIAADRRICDGSLNVHVDHVSRSETNRRGSLGSGGNVCILPFSLLFDEPYLSVLWLSPYTWSPRLHLIQWILTWTNLPCRLSSLV
jgi:hypothetical protein